MYYLNQPIRKLNQTTHHHSEVGTRKEFEDGKVREILTDLGYKLQDFGKYFRAQALYRDGKNHCSLKVWKNSGWCIDYGHDEKGFPISQLVRLTLNTNDPKIISQYVSGQKIIEAPREKVKLTMPRYYPEECLSRLFPNYTFYKKKNISEITQKKYKLGLASTGKMYQRLVFPIYDDVKQIIGFSGRLYNWEEGSSSAKWKHLGEKQTWLYPYNLDESFREKLDDGAELRIVESIGDSMALTENNVPNHLVNFGLSCSPAMQGFILAKDPERIIISTNNDSHKEKNSGKIAAIKTMAKLSGVINVDRVKIQLPTQNDVSDMHVAGEDILTWSKSENFMSREEIVDFVNNNKGSFNKEFDKFIKKL